MPAPSRDRISRPVDISTLYRGAARRVHLMVDEPGLRWAGLGGEGGQRVNSTLRSQGSRTPSGGGVRYRRNVYRPIGRENRAPVTPVNSRTRRSVLPSWYPRAPLRDITAIVRAIERRRAELQGEEVAEPTGEETNAPAAATSDLERENGLLTPLPSVAIKPQPSSANQGWKILDEINPKKSSADSDFVTPQRRLLNSIEKVREVWMEERKKLEQTPAAKKAERERKVRTLMSMR